VREFLEVVKPFVADVTHEGFDYDSVNVEQSQLDDLNENHSILLLQRISLFGDSPQNKY